MSHHDQKTHSCTLELKKNNKFKHDGAAALAKAAHRYGFKNVNKGFVFASKGAGSPVMRKKTLDGAGSEIPVTDLQSDAEYVVAVKVGTPGVTLHLDFDTGSSDLWVWSSELKHVGSSGHNIYNASKSSTSKKQHDLTWSISYGDGSMASGDVYKDMITLGSIKVPGQAVELASKLSSSFQQDIGSDGLLGLAFPSINTVVKNGKPHPVHTPVQNMITEKLIANPIFTVKLTRGGSDGFYTFGEIDTSVTTNPILYAPIDDSKGFWSFASATFTVNGQSKALDGGSAIADTGTTLMLLPDSAVEAIYGQIDGAKLDSNAGGYIYPATSTIPALTFAVGDNFFKLNEADFPYGQPDADGNVYGGIQSSGDLGFSIFGDVFLKSVYVVFDQGATRLGVAQRDD
ncbi:hypothetical protein RQP46_001643 [Phenoliferia psychrophenolica]